MGMNFSAISDALSAALGGQNPNAYVPAGGVAPMPITPAMLAPRRPSYIPLSDVPRPGTMGLSARSAAPSAGATPNIPQAPLASPGDSASDYQSPLLGGAGFSLASQAFPSPLSDSSVMSAPPFQDELSALKYVAPVSPDQRAAADAQARAAGLQRELDFYNNPSNAVPKLPVTLTQAPDVPQIAFPSLPVHQVPHTNMVATALGAILSGIAPQFTGQLMNAPLVGAQNAADMMNAASLQHYQLGASQALAQNQNNMAGFDANERNAILNAEARNTGAKVDLGNALQRQQALAGIQSPLGAAQALGGTPGADGSSAAGGLLSPLISQDAAAGQAQFERALAQARYEHALKDAQMEAGIYKTGLLANARLGSAQTYGQTRENVAATMAGAHTQGIEAQQAGALQRNQNTNATRADISSAQIDAQVKMNAARIAGMLSRGGAISGKLDPVLASQLNTYGKALTQSQQGLRVAQQQAQKGADLDALLVPAAQQDAARAASFARRMAPYLQNVAAAQAQYQALLDKASAAKQAPPSQQGGAAQDGVIIGQPRLVRP